MNPASNKMQLVAKVTTPCLNCGLVVMALRIFVN